MKMQNKDHRNLLRLAEDRILVEQLSLLLKNIGSTYILDFVLVIFLLWILSNDSNALGMKVWCAAMLLSNFNGYRLSRRYAAGIEPGQAVRMVWVLVVLYALEGAIWGALAWVALDANTELGSLLVLAVLAGVLGANVGQLSAVIPVYISYSVSVLLLMVSKTWNMHNHTYELLGVLAVLYFAMLFVQALNNARSVRTTIELRFENTELVNQLRVKSDIAETAQRKAEDANAAKSKFLAAASHDLRQPLYALGLFASALNERIKFPEVRRLVENINQSVAALEGLFNALLDISRLDAGIILPKPQHFALKELMERLSLEFTPQAQSKGLSMLLEGGEMTVHSDPVLLETMLRNLISNAIRFTESGGVIVKWWSEGKQVSIEVRDTGIGIPAGDKENIFQEFLQLNNPERDRANGLGLGLAIVRRLAGLLHCTISVHSDVGAGSVFKLEVPIGNSALISDERTLFLQQMEGEPSMRVLVIDDETAVRDGMASLLGSWGHEVISAGSLIDALRSLKHAPHIIIADYRLRQGQTGIDAIQSIHAKWGSNIPSLIVTGDTAPERLREAQASGFAFMHKPVNAAKLRAFLRSVARHGN